MSDIYVLVAERDTRTPDEESRPIVWEQYVDGDSASLESVQAHQDRLGDAYGKTRIARLQFIDEESQ